MPLKNTKAKGSRNERRAMAYYEALGYKGCKSGASLGTWDCIMIGPHDAFLVQVKSNRKPGKSEMAAMEQFQCPPFMHKILMIWHDRVKEPEIIAISRARPEKEVVEMLTHPATNKPYAYTAADSTGHCLVCGEQYSSAHAKFHPFVP